MDQVGEVRNGLQLRVRVRVMGKVNVLKARMCCVGLGFWAIRWVHRLNWGTWGHCMQKSCSVLCCEPSPGPSYQ